MTRSHIFTSIEMSAVTTSVAATATSGCGSTLYNIPVDDAVCAMPYGGNHTDIMAACCGDTDVVSYYSNCGLYCLAVDQSVADLTACLYKNGAAYNEVFCNGNTTATATGTEAAADATASATVVHSAGSDSSSDDDNDDDSKGTSTASGSSSSATNSDNAAPGVQPQPVVSTLGLAIGALLFSATAFGALL